MLIVLARKRLHAFLCQQFRLHQLGVKAISWLLHLRHAFIEQGQGRGHPLLPMALGYLFGQARLPLASSTAPDGLQPAAAVGGEKGAAVTEGEVPQGRQTLQETIELLCDGPGHGGKSQLLRHLGREAMPLEPVGGQGQALLDALPERQIRPPHGSAIFIHHVHRHGGQLGFVVPGHHGRSRDAGPDGVTAQAIAHRRLRLALDEQIRHLELGLAPGPVIGAVDLDAGSLGAATEHHGSRHAGSGRRHDGAAPG
ncbi:hypothetical protein D3C73_791610 [compost metagenome]